MRPVAMSLIMRMHGHVRGMATVRVLPYPALLSPKILGGGRDLRIVLCHSSNVGSLVRIPWDGGEIQTLPYAREFVWTFCTHSQWVAKTLGTSACTWAWTLMLKPLVKLSLTIFSCASAKAERSLSSLYGVCMYVDHFWVYSQIWIPHKNVA